MKVQVVEEPRAGGKKLVVQVVYKVNGKTKKQNKEIFGLNERRKAEKLRSQLENSEKVDVIDQKITFEFAINSYIKFVNEIFYYLGADKLDNLLFLELRDLLYGMDSAIDIVPEGCF